MVGFVQTVHGNGSMKNHKVQCFYGKETQHYDIEKSELFDNGDGVKIDKIVTKGKAQVQVQAQQLSEATDAATQKTEDAQ